MPVDEDESPAKSGMVMFFAFLIFGLVPLLCMPSPGVAYSADPKLAYLSFSTIDFDDKATTLFGMSIAFTAVALFVLGAIKSKFSTQSWWYSGLAVLLNGSISAGASYLVGFLSVLTSWQPSLILSVGSNGL